MTHLEGHPPPQTTLPMTAAPDRPRACTPEQAASTFLTHRKGETVNDSHCFKLLRLGYLLCSMAQLAQTLLRSASLSRLQFQGAHGCLRVWSSSAGCRFSCFWFVCLFVCFLLKEPKLWGWADQRLSPSCPWVGYLSKTEGSNTYLVWLFRGLN